MTESVGTHADGDPAGAPEARGGRRTGRGLRIQRIYTTEGVHPYDEVVWERRDVVMTNWRDGTVNFEQRGVEFPDFWSPNAVNIVTTKYFRGAVGTPQREWSLRQLIDRVVKKYRATGEEHGYFATPKDAEIFEQELTWMLLHQVFSFNSPVWFNVGTTAPQQVSACQPYHAPVSTPAGLVPIGRLVEDNAVGTKVFDAHGVTRIMATKANGVKNVLRVRTDTGHALDVTADHLVWRASDEWDGAFVEAGALRPGDLLLEVSPEIGGRDRRCVSITRIDNLGPMDVYDIQTESGEYLSSDLRVHNCFILSVDDTMESILNWYREEGLIFKGGSGAGLNLSRIRSSKELLSSGGTASGPVSFMRGADASAGTIKSGGATRRAAKMVVLDVDHPDIEEFIECKAREEDKIRALRDAGFDMDLSGKDIYSVQYQNANNSVRVSDEFMRAVEAGKEFGLRARLTGEVIETVDARTLFRKMAQAAWECADPGIQYDDTINDWHTNPETGRITASNPCFPADQRVVTDKGLVRIGDLVARAAQGETFDVYTNDITNSQTPAARVVATRPTQYMVTGTNEVLELRFSDGSRLRCTPRHRLWTTNRGWVHADELTCADEVVRSFHYAARPLASQLLPSPALDVARAARGAAVADLPEKWDVELAEYLGWLVGGGDLTGAGAVTVYDDDWARQQVFDRHRRLLDRLAGGANSTQQNGTARLRAGTEVFRRFLAALGVTGGQGRTVPEPVFQAPQDALTAFLRGLYDAAGRVVASMGTGHVGLASHSEELLLGVQELLASLGVASRVCAVPSGGVGRTGTHDTTVHDDGPSYDLQISGGNIRRFAEVVGFDHPEKAGKLTRLTSTCGPDRTDETVRLTSRTSRGPETTYNLTEPRNHSYIVSGVVVANCSEYLSLDNSSCNLASINLLKFLRDDGTFDAERFVKVVELVITAMDISICFADFPTEKIAETTRAYRQLGIGYANLGALLMATAHAYDSEGGRTLAAAITSLMTAAAYRRSAELAGIVGPYEGFARNAAAHTRVMRKHAAASEAVRPVGADAARILQHANREWQECLRIGQQNGWRNAQASVIAPTGTIGLMMDCDTTGIEPDLALVKLKKLVGGGSMQIVNQTVPRALRFLGYQDEQIEAIVEYIAEHGHVVGAPGLKEEHYEVFDCAMGERAISPMGHVRMMAAVQPFISGGISKCVVGDTLVASGDGLVRIGSLYQGEAEDTFRAEHLVVSSLDGFRKTDAFYYGGTRPVRTVRLRSGHTITGTYPHRLLTAGDHGLTWKTLAEITEGDAVATQYGADLWSTVPASLRDVRVSGDTEPVRLPEEMTEELAFLLGAYAAAGHTTRSSWTVTVTSPVPEVLDRLAHAWQAVFRVQARVVHGAGVVVVSRAVVEFLDALGCSPRACDRRIPDAVLRSPRSMVLAFLQGLSLGAGVTTSPEPRWVIRLDSPRLLDDLQAVLTNLGVRHGRVTTRDTDEIHAPGPQGQLMVSLVPFVEPDKAARAAEYLAMTISDTAEVVPGITGRELYALIPPGRTGARRRFRFLLDPGNRHVTRQTVERVSAVPGVVLPGWLRQVLDNNLHFSPVVSVEDAGTASVYDLSVPHAHAFVANGIMNHNTVNMPETATVEDVERIYFEGWKLGLKALAIYRNNCKVGQPLSDARAKKGRKESTDAGTTAPPAEARPVRRRLPKQRPSITTRFSVGGAEGYMTASSYPDDGLGEVFLKMSKQGSTLAGVMDAFSVAISIGLQHGVPLETYVRKFVNMRFDPAGLTDDPDIRMASSVMDYIFRRLALDFLPYEERADLGIFTAAERAAQVNAAYGGGEEEVDVESLRASAPLEQGARPAPPSASKPAKPAVPQVASSVELVEAQQGTSADAPLCFTCGTKMRPAGSCYVCEGCGSTSGCS